MKKPRILIVDDEPMISTIMAETLQQQDYDVVTANNGVEGLKIFAEKRIDLIILDLMMPRMDGYMFMEKLRERLEKEGRIQLFPKILILSAIEMKMDFGLSKNLGATQYLNKPVKPSELVLTVQNLLND